MSPRPNDRIQRQQQRQLHSQSPPSTYYKPSAYSFTCRGGFHLKNSSRDTKDANVDVETRIKDMYICNGIESKLQHIADYPLARSKDEAIRWFEGSHITSSGLHANSSVEGSTTSTATAAGKEATVKKGKDDKLEEETFSSYGTTRVDILTVQEVPVAPSSSVMPRQIMDPFGPLSPTNPFGSIFGGLFGGFDPWNDDDDAFTNDDNDNKKGNRGWISRVGSSKSISSSTRIGHDESGKRVSTTVTKTTVVDGEGNKTTEVETVVRHLDDGGRVERTKEIVRDDTNKKALENKRSSQTVKNTVTEKTIRSPPAASLAKESLKPPEVAMIATDCRFGLAVTDSKMDSKDPNLPNLGDANKWRKTEYFFKLGRLLPTLGVVSQYYSDKEDEEKYNNDRRQQQKSRWDKSSERNDEKSTGNNNFPVPTLPDNSRTKYYLNRLEEQMIKNLKMMKLLALEMTKDDFPKKVYTSGQKILENMGPTVERTGKLMKDVFGMWFGGRIGWGDDDGGRRR